MIGGVALNLEKIAAILKKISVKKHDLYYQNQRTCRKLKGNPDLRGKPLRGRLRGYWELYFEKRFRILYTINYEIEAIKHKDEF